MTARCVTKQISDVDDTSSHFYSKVIRQAMKDMNSHNYNRFAKVGSSSAFSGFMARK